MSFEPPLSGNERLAERWKSGNYDQLRELRIQLLSYGGEEVVPVCEPYVESLLQDGESLSPASVVYVDGEPSQCHRNAAVLYEKEDSVTKIGAGWALSDDGLWRQHSWAMRGDVLVETTEPRVLYFGVLFDGSDADEFVAKNRF